MELGSTILKAGVSGGNLANLSGTVSSDGYNLASDDGGGFLTAATDQANTDPMLGPLQDNGGPTFTPALLPGSPATDQGYGFGLTADQRGLPRTLDLAGVPNASGGDGTDIGAVESQDAGLRLLNIGVMSNQFGFNLIGPFTSVVVEASTNLVNWTPLATNPLGAGLLRFNDPGWRNLQQRFYRAELVP